MTIHTLVLTVDSFSCNCNSMNSSLSIDFKTISHLAQAMVHVYKYQCIFHCNHFSTNFNFMQQCIQISTRINSSMYIHTPAFVSFETYPIFNNNGIYQNEILTISFTDIFSGVSTRFTCPFPIIGNNTTKFMVAWITYMSRFCLCWRCTRVGTSGNPDVVLPHRAFWVQVT